MEILNTYTELKWSAWCLGAPFLLGTIPLLVWMYYSIKNRKYGIVVGLIIIEIISFLVFKEYVRLVNTGKSDHVYHEVIIKDKTAIDPFKYEIIEQKGKITIIKELD